MGLFSSIFGSRPAAGVQLADLCFQVRQEMRFLQDYVENRTESSLAQMRLEFSKDVLMMFFAATIVQTRIQNHQRLMQTNEEVRSRYLSLLPVPPTTLVGDCLVCDDELEAIAPFVAPGTPISQVRTTRVSTTGLISLAIDYRAPEFRDDLMTGITQSKVGTDMWIPAAQTFLMRIRGVPRDSIPFDDINYLSVAFVLPFTLISESSQSFLQ